MQSQKFLDFLIFYLPKIRMIIAQQFGTLSVDCVNDVTVEKVSRYEAFENFRDLFRVIAAAKQIRKKLVLVEGVNTFDVGENSMLLAAKRFRKFLTFEY